MLPCLALAELPLLSNRRRNSRGLSLKLVRKAMRKIILLRRFIQVICFFLLLYGGFLGIRQVETRVLPFVEPPPGFGTEERIVPLQAPAGYIQVFDTYLPNKSCRFIAGEGRLFRACTLHFLSESLTWLTPLKYVLPHLFLFVVLAFLLGRFWCGWVCPLGFSQDVLGIIRKYLRLTYLNLPEIIRNPLSKFKHGLLIFLGLTSLVIAFPPLAAYQKEFFIIGCQTCPGRILFPALGGAMPTFYSFDSPILAIFSFFGIVFLLIFLGSFFVPRFWCRICPSGALTSFFNLGGAMTKEKDVLKCTRCGTCARTCPMENKYVYAEKLNKNINNINCIRCFKCVDMCPEDECLKVKFLGKTLFKSKFK